ncbi:hypothetical protein KIN20_031274, partial [Parelaphostrongylus tenuis]
NIQDVDDGNSSFNQGRGENCGQCDIKPFTGTNVRLSVDDTGVFKASRDDFDGIE